MKKLIYKKSSAVGLNAKVSVFETLKSHKYYRTVTYTETGKKINSYRSYFSCLLFLN